jgi:hypothetical protein
MPDRHEWSNAEKKITRRAYEAARQTVLAKVLAEFKAQAAHVTTVDGMWSIVDEWRQRRHELDDLLSYRYSQLTSVLARLVFAGHLDEKQLTGLSEDKLEEIRRVVSVMRAP